MSSEREIARPSSPHVKLGAGKLTTYNSCFFLAVLIVQLPLAASANDTGGYLPRAHNVTCAGKACGRNSVCRNVVDPVSEVVSPVCVDRRQLPWRSERCAIGEPLLVRSNSLYRRSSLDVFRCGYLTACPFGYLCDGGVCCEDTPPPSPTSCDGLVCPAGSFCVVKGVLPPCSVPPCANNPIPCQFLCPPPKPVATCEESPPVSCDDLQRNELCPEGYRCEETIVEVPCPIPDCAYDPTPCPFACNRKGRMVATCIEMMPEKPGQCPEPVGVPCTRDCVEDVSCSGDEKCCPTTCGGFTCSAPVPPRITCADLNCGPDKNCVDSREGSMCIPIDICTLLPETGPCRAAFTRYYYDPTGPEPGCKTFIYGGCRGNSNNFHTLEACVSACGHTTV